MIDLHGMTSPNVRKIFIALEELGLQYRFHHVKVLLGEQFGPRFRALNPNSKVPVIVDHDGLDGEPVTVFESGAILLYLAEKAGRFLPSTRGAHYEMLQWLMLQVANVGPMLGQLNHYVMYAAEGNDYSLRRYRNEALRLYALLDERLADRRFLAGDYGLADIATWPWLAYLERHGQSWAQYPNLRRWHDAIALRPAVTRALEAIARIEKDDAATMAEASPATLDRFFNRTGP
ncbi:glutathione S-transferase family protein [Hydrocarboniphaga sp.]|uniref:glutathione S-transferase family protein n=1 Tax=Hydrocarboniphaga sp. TaxID=2033016 RepID=UPI003D0C6238